MSIIRNLVAAGLLLAVPSGAVGWHELEGYTFEDYVAEYARSYPTAEETASRKALFEARLEDIRAHNADPSLTYRRGVNQFSDRTEEEMKASRGLHKGRSRMEHARRAADLRSAAPKAKVSLQDLPSSVDWRQKGVITPVKNQGECGSCWAFASTETLESHWAIKTGRLEELSEQFILDCTPNPDRCGGTGGCDGGTGELAYTRLAELGGIPSEWTYPYVSGTGKASTCHGLPLPPQHPHSGGIMAAANVTGYKSTKQNSYTDMMTTLATVGPLAVSVDASVWSDYESGIFTGGNKTNPDLDHLVQLVGYGEENGMGYWLVRNSWTELWGEDGYIRLARYGEGKEPCGVDISPADGNGCENGPASVPVCGQSGVLYDGTYPLV